MDDHGDIYVLGEFRGPVDFDPGPGVHVHTSESSSATFLSKFNSSGQFLWLRVLESTYYIYPMGLAADSTGGVYILGSFRGTVDFDPGPGVEEHTVDEWPECSSLAKFDSNGSFQWVRIWRAGGYSVAEAISADGAGDIYVTGDFWGTIDLDPGPGTDEYESEHDQDNYISKFNSDGEFLWARTWGSEGQDYSYGIKADASGNVYVAGTYNEISSALGDMVYSTGNGEAFLRKYDSSGLCRWDLILAKDGENRATDIAADDSDNVYVTGYFEGITDFDPGFGKDEHASNGYKDIFLLKVDPSGGLQWACTWGGKFYDLGETVAVDSFSNAYIAGTFNDTVDFDPGPGCCEHTTLGCTEMFMTKILPGGNW